MEGQLGPVWMEGSEGRGGLLRWVASILYLLGVRGGSFGMRWDFQRGGGGSGGEAHFEIRG